MPDSLVNNMNLITLIIVDLLLFWIIKLGFCPLSLWEYIYDLLPIHWYEYQYTTPKVDVIIFMGVILCQYVMFFISLGLSAFRHSESLFVSYMRQFLLLFVEH